MVMEAWHNVGDEQIRLAAVKEKINKNVEMNLWHGGQSELNLKLMLLNSYNRGLKL